jgi:hypothetical protein
MMNSKEKATKFANMMGKYKDRWVALGENGSKVIASAKDLKELDTKLTDYKREYVISKVLTPEKAFIPWLTLR